MLKNEDKLVDAFCRIHKLTDKHDVRLMEDEKWDTTGVGVYKDGKLAWGATLAEIAMDIILEEQGDE